MCNDGQMTEREAKSEDVTAPVFRTGDKEARERARLERRGARRLVSNGMRNVPGWLDFLLAFGGGFGERLPV